jgi:exosortase
MADQKAQSAVRFPVGSGQTGMPPSAKRIPWGIVLPIIGLLAIAGWAYWPAIGDISSAWLSNPDYTHGFFVIPISVWLLWARRSQAPVADVAPDWRGLLLLAAAGLVRILGGRFYIPQIDAWSIPIWIGGVVWLLFGWKTFRWALPSIAFLWFATPLPGTIEIALGTPLQKLAAELSTFVLQVIGQPALVQGTTILLDDQVLDVERACSGLRMFYGIFALATACIALTQLSRGKALLVLFIAAPVAIAANVVRIVATGILMKYFSSEAARKFEHDWAGYVMIPLAVFLFLLFLRIIARVLHRFQEPGGVAWLTKWGLVAIIFFAALFAWGQHQEARAITTLRRMADNYESEQDWPKSIQYLTRYIRAMPQDQKAFAHLAELYLAHANHFQDQLRAIELLRDAWKQQPDREDLALNAIQLGLRIQQYNDAAELCDELLAKTNKAETRDAAVKFRAAALYACIQSGDNRGDYTWENVKDAFEIALKLPTYDIGEAVALAEVYREHMTSMEKAERDKLADALMDRVVNERANDPIAWLARYDYGVRKADKSPVAIAETDKDLARALKLSEQQPQNPATSLVFLAAAAKAQGGGKNEEAAQLIQRAIDVAPSDSRPYLMLAQLKRNSGTPEARRDAIQVLRKGAEQTGKNAGLTLPLAQLLAEAGEVSEAETEIAPLERFLSRNDGQDKAVLRVNVGLVRAQIFHTRDGAQAALLYLRDLLREADVRLTEQRAPSDLAKCFALLAKLYSELGAPDLALDAYRQATRIDPQNRQWQFQSAVLAQQTGDLKAADIDFRELIQRGQNDGATRAALVEVEIQRQLQRSTKERDWDEAKRLLGVAQKARASPTVVRLLEVEILASQGDVETAEAKIVKLAEETPQDAAPWRALAILRLKHNDAKGAVEAAKRFSELSDNPVEASTLRAVILAQLHQVDAAVEQLSGTVDKAAPDKLPQAALALSQLFVQIDRRDDAFNALEQAHAKVPQNLQLVDSLANMAWLSQDWKKLEKYESWLKSIEGNDGTLWKAYRAQRLLLAAKSADDEQFQEVVGLVDAIIRERPRWYKAHFLQGEIAFRMNRIDAAAKAYEKAWDLGGRGVLLADRLIDLMTRQGRLDEARRYVVQVQDYFAISPGLFDRAVPYLTHGNESRDMLRLAENFVKQNPQDSDAHLRFGRVLLMQANSQEGEQKNKSIDQANSEFRRAIELAPNDVRPWAASVMLFGQSVQTRAQALKVMEELAAQTKIDELERTFVLAQLYDLMGLTSRAQVLFQRAASVAEANTKPTSASDVLGRTAQFYYSRVPALAELYARRSLALNPANSDAKLVLLLLLANRTDDASLQEAMRLVDEKSTKSALDPALDVRIRAALLARRGKAQDLDAAIEMLQRSLSQSREDKLLLARLYEQTGQVPPALDLLQQLTRSAGAQPNELIEYLRFWQKHFLKGDNADSGAQFAGAAEDVYARLGELPGQLPERLRWQLREARARNLESNELSPQQCLTVVSQILGTNAAKRLKDQEAKLLFQQIITVLLQENCDEGAAQLAANPPQDISSTEAAVWLCHGFIAVAPPKESEPKRQQMIDNLLAAHPDNAVVIKAVGDYSFMAGNYEAAVEAYRKVLAMAPRMKLAENNLALALAELPDRMGEARQVLSSALERAKNDVDLLDSQATLEIIDKRPEQAIPLLEQVIAHSPESPVPRLHLAMAYDGAGDKNRARESIFAAAALGVGQRVLAPREKKSLDDLQSRYMENSTTSGSNQSAANGIAESIR